MDMISREIDKQMDRTRDTNISGRGKQSTKAAALEESKVTMQLDSLRNDYFFKDPMNKANTIFRRKLRSPLLSNFITESQKIQNFMHVSLQIVALILFRVKTI